MRGFRNQASQAIGSETMPPNRFVHCALIRGEIKQLDWRRPDRRPGGPVVDRRFRPACSTVWPLSGAETKENR